MGTISLFISQVKRASIRDKTRWKLIREFNAPRDHMLGEKLIDDFEEVSHFFIPSGSECAYSLEEILHDQLVASRLL